MIKVTKLSKRRERLLDTIIMSGCTGFCFIKCANSKLYYDSPTHELNFKVHPEGSYEPVESIWELIYGNDLQVYDKLLGDFIYG